MKLAKILSILNSEPLLCSDTYRATLLEMFQQHAELGRDEFRAGRTGMAKSGSELDVRQMEIKDGVAIIPVGGPLGVDLGEFEKGAGAVDMDDICAEIEEAEENDDVEGIILNFDSPGGTVQGTSETAQKILACEKPVYAFTRGTMASAAYWLGASCNGIFASPGAKIGNIGVCIAIPDMSRAAEMAGVKIKVFASGSIKGIGTPGTSLSTDQEIFLKNHVAELAQEFYSHVKAQRPNVSDGDMQGQFYTGKSAVAKGFIDEVMPDIESVAAFLR